MHESEMFFVNAFRLASTSLALTRVWAASSDDAPALVKEAIDRTFAQRDPVAALGALALHDDAVVIGDTSSDVRTARHPLVTSAPHARSFIGIPLVAAGGTRLGTLCGVDERPRTFSDADLAIMFDVGALLTSHVRTVEACADGGVIPGLTRSEAEVDRDTFERAAIGIAHTCFDGTIVRANPYLCALLGYAEPDVKGRSFVDITHPDDIDQNLHHFMEMVAGRCESYRMEKRFLRADGTYVWTMLSVALRRTAAGQPDYMIATIQDISAQKAIEASLGDLRASLVAQVTEQTRQLNKRNEAMREHVKQLLETQRMQALAERRLRTITDNVPAMIGYWDSDLRCTFANEAYRHWFGIDPDRIVGMSMRELMGEQLYAQNESLALAALAGKAQHFERELIKADGSLSYTDAHYLPDIDENGVTRGFQVLVTDVTSLQTARYALEEANRRLAFEATTDDLTGLSNRRTFNERSEAAFRRACNGDVPYALILLDLDIFKKINDEYGHKTGDDVLRLTGRILRDQLRDSDDVAARIGGEEFGMLCIGNVSIETACQLAERIRSKINKEAIVTPRGRVTFTGSFGVALSHPSDTTIKDIYVRADLALYAAKAAGRNCVSFRTAGAAPDKRAG